MENLENYENIPVKRSFGNKFFSFKNIVIAVLILLLLSFIVSNMVLVRKVSNMQVTQDTTILAIKQEIKNVYSQEIAALKTDVVKGDENLLALINSLNLNLKDLTDVIQVTTKTSSTFKKEVGQIKGQLKNTQEILSKIDSTLRANGDTIDVGSIDPILNNVPCKPSGEYNFSDTSTNFKWSANLNFNQEPAVFTLNPKYESTITLLTTLEKKGFLGLGHPLYKVTVASDDPNAVYKVSGGVIIPPKELFSFGVGIGYSGMLTSLGELKHGATVSVALYKKIFSIYKK